MLVCFSAGLATTVLPAPAVALIVGNQSGVVPATTVPPNQYPGWTSGDPGWHNVAVNRNYVYLGDGWVLSARHVGYNATNGLRFQTFLPDGSPGPIERFDRIPGTYYFDYGYGTASARQYAVSNPPSIQSEDGEPIPLNASNGTNFTDLQLFRINGDPGLPPVKLPTQPLPSDFTRVDAPELVAIGFGPGRQTNERTWYITLDPEDEENWSWTLNEPPTYDETKKGFLQNSNNFAKRFGTNRITDARPNEDGDPADPGAIDYSDKFRGVVSDSTVVWDVKTGDGVTRAAIGTFTTYDPMTAPGVTELEFQAQGGNSGSSVFYKRGTQWELSGIIHEIDIFPKQSPGAAVYGNSTFMSNLYYYNLDYTNSIRDIIENHPNYSHVGDVNLDGKVNDADMAALNAGWGYNNGLGIGNVESWKRGDIDRDGRVTALDYVVLRLTLGGLGTGSAASNAAPEPTAVVLTGIGTLFLSFAMRRLRR